MNMGKFSYSKDKEIIRWTISNKEIWMLMLISKVNISNFIFKIRGIIISSINKIDRFELIFVEM